LKKSQKSKVKSQKFKKIKIGVLMGGMSTEREISLKSGRAVYNALIQKGYDAVAIDVGRDIYSRIITERIDVAFIALHGKYGEDGAVQGLLEMAGILYTGSDVLSSAVCANKVLAKKLFMLNNIPTPGFKAVGEGDIIDYSVFEGLGLPVIVKPNSQGSTIGVSVVKSKKDIKKAIRKALKYDDTALVEKFVDGREMTVGILDGRALPVVEIKPKCGIYDFKAKYTKGMTEYIVPAGITGVLKKKLVDIALKAFNTLGCRDVARVDIVLDKKNRPYVLEVNTIPGMTELSLLPKAALCAGIGFPDLVEKILLRAAGDKMKTISGGENGI